MFYFADRLISGSLPVNAFSLFDLSKLSECILLADKITTLPGRGIPNSTFDKLKKAKIPEEINVDDNSTDSTLSGELNLLV
jgi:hypothetical protein